MRNLQKITTFLLLTVISFSSFAQHQNAKIRGTVENQTKVLEAATINLLHAKDSSLVKMALTNKLGQFEMENLKPASYFIKISVVGFTEYYSDLIDLVKNNEVNLNSIQLKNADKGLKDVIVSTKKPLIEQKIDRLVVNVEVSPSNTGSNALEVLEKSPGITVDRDGNISLKGKAGVVVYVDGRPTYLSASDLASMLRNMNSTQIELLEIMTNPPAKYDAAGNSGVINIKTKKDKKIGFNGSTTLGVTQGFYFRNNQSLNLNYRTKKVNLFSTFSRSENKRRQGLNILRNFKDVNTKELLSTFDQQAVMVSKDDSYNFKLGLDYFISKKTTLGVVTTGFSNPENTINHNTTDIFNKNGALVNKTNAISNFEENWKNISANVNLRHVIDSTGKEISADLDYIKYTSRNSTALYNSYYNSLGNPILPFDTLVGNLPGDIKIYSAKVDYTHPLKNGGRFEAGLKSSYVQNDNNAIYDSVQNNVLVRDKGRSNHFVYEENINAAYVNYSQPFNKKWSGQFGLRVENTNAKGDLKTTGESFKRNYTQVFPTAYISYNANENNQFVLNYGRRINRPNYRDLNPFIYFLDKYTFQQGNPNLRPMFSHNIELSHTFKGKLNTSINYSKTNDVYTEVLEQNEAKNETFVKNSNIATLSNIGIAISYNTQVTKWWTTSIYTNVYKNRFQGVVNNTNYDEGAVTGLINFSNQINLGKDWSAEVGGFYRTKGVEGVFVINPIGQIQFGISKPVMNKKGNIRLSVRDVFATQSNMKGYSKYSNIDVQFTNAQDRRFVSLSFSYRFGKATVSGPKKRVSSAEEELNRVGK